MRFWNEISDRLAGLTGTASPEVARAALNEFDVRDIQAVRVSEGGGGNGGSQPGAVRRLDLGVVDVSDLLTDSVLLYTPDSGEIVLGVYLRDVTFTDAFGMAVACTDGTSAEDTNNLAAVTTGFYNESVRGTAAGRLATRTAITPIRAGLTEDDASQPIASAWEADHHYVPDSTTSESLIVASGHLRLTNDDGDSGGSVPDFPGNFGGSVVDNDLTWTDEGELPTIGSMHVYADVATPVAP